MASGDHSDQVACWNGVQGDAWVTAQEHMDELLEPLTQVILDVAAVKAEESVIDIGCGCGETSVRLGKTAKNVLGIDISKQMLERAADLASSSDHVEFLLADAGEHQLDCDFDVLFSRYGSMFFSKPATAYANLRRALKPGGRLCFICWKSARENPWLSVPTGIAQKFLPKAKPTNPTDPGPFAFADPDHIRAVLAGGGFQNVKIEPFATQVTVGNNVEHALQLITTVLGPPRRVLEELNTGDRDAALASIGTGLAEHLHDGKVVMGAASWIVTGDRD